MKNLKPKKPKPKKPVGRPTKYKPELCELATKFCMLGATNDGLARMFEVSCSTIELWIRTIPEFSRAVKEGREVADATVAKSLYHRACGYSHEAVKIFNDGGKPMIVSYIEHYPPDTAAAFIWLKNRRPGEWRDRKEVAVSPDSAAATVLAALNAVDDEADEG